MKLLSLSDRLFLLFTGLLAAYQVAAGMDSLPGLAVTGYTIAFGVLLVASLLLIILGLEALENQSVVVVSTLIPLGLSLGLVARHLPGFAQGYLIFSIVGLLAVAGTRFFATRRLAILALAGVHCVSGLIIFLLPLALSVSGRAPAGFALVGVGGALIGLGGLLLSFLKSGRPLLSAARIQAVLPALLFLMTLAFVAGPAAL